MGQIETHEVVIAGGGPTGLMLAGELALAGVDVAIVEQRADQSLDGSRAGGLHARSLELLAQRGIAERFLDAGEAMQTQGFALIPLDIGDLPSSFPHGLALGQPDIERLLAGWALDDLGVPIIRGREVVGLAHEADGVDVALSDGSEVRAAYLVGCDGGRSVVRREAGIDFPGLEASTSWMIAEVEMDGEPEIGIRRDDVGQHALGRRAPGEPIRVVLTEREVRHARPPTFEDLRTALTEVYGTDFGLRSATWISRFTDMVRQAATYRRGRVLLAGDAAHVHPPHGGQGLNTGLHDAVNLGWKLAQVVRGISHDDLLDTYHDERHPVGAAVLRDTLAMVAMSQPGERHDALRAVLAEVLSLDEPRRQLGGRLSGLTARYDLGDEHPLVGRRAPDLDLGAGPDGSAITVLALLRRGRPVLLDLSGGFGGGIGPWADRVEVVRARRTAATWDMPGVGEAPAPPAALIRPDGHIAWVGDPDDPTLTAALRRWFGDPQPTLQRAG